MAVSAHPLCSTNLSASSNTDGQRPRMRDRSSDRASCPVWLVIDSLGWISASSLIPWGVHLEEPGEKQRERKSDADSDHNPAHNPFGDIERTERPASPPAPSSQRGRGIEGDRDRKRCAASVRRRSSLAGESVRASFRRGLTEVGPAILSSSNQPSRCVLRKPWKAGCWRALRDHASGCQRKV